MAWPKGKPRPEGAGRKKGTPNKASLPILELCEKHNCNPAEALIKCMEDPEYRFLAAKELMQYIYPKKRALEVDANVNMELAQKAQEYSELPKEEQIQIMKQELKKLEGK